MSKPLIYLDHAATTPLSDKALQAMLPYFSEQFFNPSAAYLPALTVRAAYLTAKDRIGRVIGAKGDDLVMTSGATEANALARAVVSPDGEALILATEHASLRNAGANASSKSPNAVNMDTNASADLNNASNVDPSPSSTSFANPTTREIRVDHTGLIDFEDLKAKLSPRTELVSVSLANNELGTIQPLAKVAKVVATERMRRLQAGEKRPIYLHSDASQALSLLSVNVARLGVDLLTLNAAKVYGPKGVGALYHGHQVRLRPLVPGGGQENGLRGGTENVPGVIGFAMALRVGLKDETITVSGESSMTTVVEVSNSKERMLRPSLPIRRPFMASSGIFTIVAVADCGICGERRCMASIKTRRAVSSTSRFDFSSSSRL